ncbi:MAG: hypothetical protein KDD60_08905 [Bdellovibrionales bacterium]|nr:hypothetical protein [Bdellovibrionales bacterium]
MKGQPCLYDYTAILLISAGIVALGVHELYQKNGSYGGRNSKSGDQVVMQQLEEDLSGEFAKGAPKVALEQRTENQRRASYEWEKAESSKSSSSSSESSPRSVVGSVTREVKGLVQGMIKALLGSPPKEKL